MSDQNTTIVIYGGAGDLAQRKLLPALYNLRCKGRLPKNVTIVGSGRREFSDDQFREMSFKGAREIGGLITEKEEWDDFAKNLYYIDSDTSKSESVAKFKNRLEKLEGGGTRVNRLYYLSIAPQIFEATIANLGESGLAYDGDGWRRVVIEKPFGYDLNSAMHLNKVVDSVFREDQIFRIDHYLGKETVQNLLVLRFANSIFEPIWNRNYIDNVQISVSEAVDVSDRGAYYDQSGVIRDMFQNHLLQLVALAAMEPPSVADAESLRNKRVEVLQAIRRGGAADAIKHAVRGQYDGYLEEKGVPENSITPTFGAMRLYIDNWRWRGVPFYLRTGKAMAQKVTEVIIQFQQPPHSMFTLGPHEELPSNILGVCIQPDEGSHLKFGVKVPDMGMKVQPVNMEFRYEQAFKEQPIPEAYELLLEDAIEGDASLFIRSDQIEESWRIIDPLLHAWEDHSEQSGPLHKYPRGSWGPNAGDDLLAQDGRAWQRVCGSHDDDCC